MVTMAAAYFQLEKEANQPVERIFRDRNNPLDFMTDEQLLGRYRLDRPTIFELCDNLEHDRHRAPKRSQAIPVPLQRLTLASHESII